MVGLPLVVVWLLVPLVVTACTVTVPNTFVNGTPADADQVNANFDAVEIAVNDNDARLRAPIRFPSSLYLTSCHLSDPKRAFEFPIRSRSGRSLGPSASHGC